MGCNYPRRSISDSWWVVGSGIRCTTGHPHRIENYQRCLAAPNHDAQACHKSFHKQFARNEQKAHWVPAATVGLSPIAITWLLVWGLVALVRWLRRGPEPTTLTCDGPCPPRKHGRH